MFGEDYFHARAGLANLAARVLRLADSTGADPSALTENGVEQGLSSPYLFVVCGESSSGKSSLLNGIFGEDVCSVDSAASAKRVQWYKYGKKDKDVEVTPAIEECYRPVAFLKHFNLMDTPGTNSRVKEHQETAARFLPASDLIFWVLPVHNPWGASLWDFISSQDEATLKKSVMILQQTDLKEAGELDIIMGHLNDLARQRLLFLPPIFPVSAKWAIESKRSSPVDEALWRKSGYPALEQHVADAVANSPARQKMLVDIRKALADVLRNIEKTVEHRAELLEGNEHFLQKLEAEVDSERRKYSSDFTEKFAEMRDVFASKNKEMKRYVRRKLGFFSSLKSLLLAENTSKAIESSLVDLVEASVIDQADVDGEHLVKQCHEHWDSVRPRVKDRLAIDLDDFDDKADGFDAVRESFNRRMGLSARQAVMSIRIRKALSLKIATRREHLKHCLYFVFVFLLAAGVTGSLQVAPQWYISWVFVLLATLAMLFFIIRVRLTGKLITKSLGRRLESERGGMVSALETDYKEGVRSFYREYGSLLRSVRQHIFDAQQELQPNLEQRNQLFLELMIIERDH